MPTGTAELGWGDGGLKQQWAEQTRGGAAVETREYDELLRAGGFGAARRPR